MRINPIMCAALILSPLSAHAQQSVNSTWPVATNSRVRIQAPILGAQRQAGTLVAATGDSIIFQPIDQVATRSLALTDITRMEVARGTHTNRWKGALLGFAILGGAGAAYTAGSWSKDQEGAQFMDMGRWGDAAIVGGFTGILGALTGALIGSRQTDTWVPVQIR